MDTDDFLSKIHGAETMNPESEVFDEYRWLLVDDSDRYIVLSVSSMRKKVI